MRAGDKACYIPHEHYAFKEHKDTGFPFEMGWKTGRKVPGDPTKEEVLPMTVNEVKLKLRHLRQQDQMRAANEMKRFVLIRPKGHWDAVVRSVRSVDGKQVADLDIKDPTTGATLHCDGVAIDPDGKTLHSCHLPAGHVPQEEPEEPTDPDEQ